MQVHSNTGFALVRLNSGHVKYLHGSPLSESQSSARMTPNLLLPPKPALAVKDCSYNNCGDVPMINPVTFAGLGGEFKFLNDNEKISDCTTTQTGETIMTTTGGRVIYLDNKLDCAKVRAEVFVESEELVLIGKEIDRIMVTEMLGGEGNGIVFAGMFGKSEVEARLVLVANDERKLFDTPSGIRYWGVIAVGGLICLHHPEGVHCWNRKNTSMAKNYYTARHQIE